MITVSMSNCDNDGFGEFCRKVNLYRLESLIHQYHDSARDNECYCLPLTINDEFFHVLTYSDGFILAINDNMIYAINPSLNSKIWGEAYYYQDDDGYMVDINGRYCEVKTLIPDIVAEVIMHLPKNKSLKLFYIEAIRQVTNKYINFAKES